MQKAKQGDIATTLSVLRNSKSIRDLLNRACRQHHKRLKFRSSFGYIIDNVNLINILVSIMIVALQRTVCACVDLEFDNESIEFAK